MQAAGRTPLTPPDAATPRTKVALLVGVALLAVVLDVITKTWVVSWDTGREIELLGGAVTLRESRNSGAAFGLAQGATLALSVVAIVVVVVILRIARTLRARGWAIALGLISGGALGNLVDRVLRDPGVLRGAVVDFIDLPFWPSFNVADSAIVVGGALAVLLSFLGVEPRGAEHAQADDATGDTES